MDTQEFRDFLLTRVAAERDAAAKARDPIVAEAHRANVVSFEKQLAEVTLPPFSGGIQTG